jgi:uncharacterized membrane protein
MKNWYIFYGLLGLTGFADALYLTFTHYRQHTLGCSIITGCDEVLTSEYAVVSGIPLALIGVVYYLALIAGALIWYQTEHMGVYKSVLTVNMLGFFASLYLVYVQWALIQAFCQYCLLSAAITTGMLVIILFSGSPGANPPNNRQ